MPEWLTSAAIVAAISLIVSTLSGTYWNRRSSKEAREIADRNLSRGERAQAAARFRASSSEWFDALKTLRGIRKGGGDAQRDEEAVEAVIQARHRNFEHLAMLEVIAGSGVVAAARKLLAIANQEFRAIQGAKGVVEPDLAERKSLQKDFVTAARAEMGLDSLDQEP